MFDKFDKIHEIVDQQGRVEMFRISEEAANRAAKALVELGLEHDMQSACLFWTVDEAAGPQETVVVALSATDFQKDLLRGYVEILDITDGQ